MAKNVNKISLVQAAELGNLPKHEVVDTPTLEWIKAHNPYQFKGGSRVNLKIDFEQVIKKVNHDWFFSKERINSLHGVKHSLRVSFFSIVLLKNRKLEFSEIKNCVKISSLIHDIRRKNDGDDSKHGFRAAQWFKKHYKEVEDFYSLKLNDYQKDGIYWSIFFHEKSYNEIEISENYKKYQLSIDTLKTADTLDRYCQPKIKWWPNDKYLKIKPSELLKKIAYNLVVESEGLFLNGEGNEEAFTQSLKNLINFKK